MEENQKSPEATPPTPPPVEKVAKPRSKMVRVIVLRPFKVGDVIYDRVGSKVEVPESEVPRLTAVKKGQAKGFGDRLNEEMEYHEIQLARLAG